MLHDQLFWAALQGHITSKYLLLMVMFMPIYSKSVYIFDSMWFCVCTKVMVSKWLAPQTKWPGDVNNIAIVNVSRPGDLWRCLLMLCKNGNSCKSQVPVIKMVF
jgi:hypothetical protein